MTKCPKSESAQELIVCPCPLLFHLIPLFPLQLFFSALLNLDDPHPLSPSDSVTFYLSYLSCFRSNCRKSCTTSGQFFKYYLDAAQHMKSTSNIQETRITSSFFAGTSRRYGISETWFFLSWIRPGGIQVLCLSRVPSVILSIKRCCSRTPAPKILSVYYILTVSNNANMFKFLDPIVLHLDCFPSVFLPVDLSAQRQKKVGN